jgi:GNAT superfamily N-acetyltransferase
MRADMPEAPPQMERRREGYLVSTDPARLDAEAIHAFLRTSYWAPARSLEAVRRSLRHSLCFGLYRDGRQVGLARVVTDYATFAYLCDVYVLPEERGRGLGLWLMECVMSYPQLQRLRRFLLFTKDAHELYRKFGFAECLAPERVMEIVDPAY